MHQNTTTAANLPTAGIMLSAGVKEPCMTVIILAVAFGLVMIALSVQANFRFRQEQKLPMQWALSRSRPLSSTVIWSAPRVLALSLIPLLAISVLTLFAIGAMTLTPRPGQEGTLMPSLIFIGGIFLAVQILHLWLIEKTLRCNEE